MDEFLFPGFAVAFGLWFYWYYSFLAVLSFRRGRNLSWCVGLAPLMCMAILFVVLLKWSSPDVRADSGAILFYMIWGALWLRLALFLFFLAGVSVREDVLERQNRAAGWLICGGMMGAMLSFAGANIGKGPGPQAVLFSAVLSCQVFFGLWLCLERAVRVSDRITIDRDEGAGIRLGGWCAGAGLVLCAAVTGDWKSADATWRDFLRYGWAAIPFLLVAILAEKYFQTRAEKRVLALPASFGIAAAYMGAAGAYVSRLNAR